MSGKMRRFQAGILAAKMDKKKNKNKNKDQSNSAKKKKNSSNGGKQEKLIFKTKMRPGEDFRSYSKRIAAEKQELLSSLAFKVQAPVSEKRKQNLNR